MPTPTLDYVPQLWKAKAGGATIREQASLSAPVIARVNEGVYVFTVGENAPGGWRLGLAGNPERLYYLRRTELDPLPPGTRDPALYQGIADVVDARIVGKPIATGDSATLQAALDAANESLDNANRRTAIVKTTGASALRKVAIANRDIATGADAAAANLEKL